jgi:hypothetical protein
MTRKSRVRRSLLLCAHFLRNLAFFRAGRYRGERKKRNQYWMVVTNNCLDHCVLEWCKLFAEPKGKHHWRKIIDDEAAFGAQLLTATRMTQAEFDDYIVDMRTYRDKFVAHLDEEAVMDIPPLRPAQRAVHALYTHIAQNESGYFAEVLDGAGAFYSKYFRIARREVN